MVKVNSSPSTSEIETDVILVLFSVRIVEAISMMVHH